MAETGIKKVTMRVHKYIPSKLYGFTVGDDEDQQVFFHLGSFKPGDFASMEGQAPPPPILGERVECEIDYDNVPEGRAPRAASVLRLDAPLLLGGVVETFDSYRGYGFIIGDDGRSYHLHKSEVVGGKMPLPQLKVRFYAGLRQGRPRACHIEVVQP